jgi:phosphohistidine phosphatase SixA
MMIIRNILTFLLVCIAATTSLTAFAQSSLALALADGQHVLFMRHADAPGIGDPPGYKLDDCATQRNLGDAGRKQARTSGQWLKGQGVVQVKLYSSIWCRCTDTAKLLDMGGVVVEPSLGSFFDDMKLAKSQNEQMQKFIVKALKDQPGKPLILVTHHVNIETYTGKVVNVGDMVLVKVDAQGRYLSHTLYPSPI